MSELSINTPIFTADYADSVNAAVQEKIDSKLFMLCNYSPDEYPVFSEKEAFEVSVNDLYRFVFDAGFVLGKLEYIVKNANLHNQNIGGKIYQAAKDLRVLAERIKDLRIYKTHNCDDRNGFFAQLERYNFGRAIGHSFLTSEDDYQYINTNQLLKIRDTLIARITEFIDAVALLDDEDKAALIAEWRKVIISHYCKSHNQIYLGQLMSAMVQRLGQEELKKINSNNAFKYAQEWIQKYYQHSISVLRAQEEKHRKGIHEAEEYMADPQCDESLKANIMAEKKEEEDRLLKVQEKLNVLDGMDEMDKDSLFNRFFELLSTNLEELISSGNYRTMLPQDLLQVHIRTHFNNVPLPVIA